MEGLERSYYRRTPITCESSCYLLSELDDKRQLVGLDKIQEVLFGHLTIKSVAKFIKLEHKPFGHKYEKHTNKILLSLVYEHHRIYQCDTAKPEGDQ